MFNNCPLASVEHFTIEYQWQKSTFCATSKRHFFGLIFCMRTISKTPFAAMNERGRSLPTRRLRVGGRLRQRRRRQTTPPAAALSPHAASGSVGRHSAFGLHIPAFGRRFGLRPQPPGLYPARWTSLRQRIGGVVGNFDSLNEGCTLKKACSLTENILKSVSVTGRVESGGSRPYQNNVSTRSTNGSAPYQCRHSHVIASTNEVSHVIPSTNGVAASRTFRRQIWAWRADLA